MARSRSAAVSTADSDFAEIIAWYEDLLDRTTPPTELQWEPVKIGPTWQWDNGWLLPDLTLGWRVLAWCGVWLRDKHGNPWQFTAEQTRFILWYFAVDESGEFLYHSAVLQRLKGWGKDPIAACLAAVSMFGEVTFDRFDGDVPMGREEPAAWVQIVAVSQEQTQNTMKLFPSLISAEARKFYGIQIGKLNVWGLGDTRQTQAITSSPLSVEGGRPTLMIRNEIQNWNSSNDGHAMAGATEGNVTKSEGAIARILDICNAYRPGEESVGQLRREAWEATQGEDATAADFGLLYDSLEAPPEAPLTPEAAPSVVESIRGDATWLNTKRIVKSIMDPYNSPAESRRKWYNQITAVEDAWVEPRDVYATANPDDEIAEDDRVVLFGDGSKSNDATGLVACRMSDGFLQTLFAFEPKAGAQVDRLAVDRAVIAAFEKYRVLAFHFDPSHAKADDSIDDDRYWWPLCDEWHERYQNKLKLWPVQSGPRRHSVAFDMLLPSSQQLFQPAVGQLAEDIESAARAKAAGGPYTPIHHGGKRLMAHMNNARRREGRYGLSIGKENRSSSRKIDLAVCAIGARMLWRQMRLTKKAGTPGRGRVIVLN